MLIAVTAADQSLIALCRDVASRIPDAACIACAPGSTGLAEEADVRIWDMDEQAEMPANWEQAPERHVFLVRRVVIQSLVTRHPEARANTILKPVSPAALEVCLTRLARSRSDQRTAAVLRSDTADADAFLDCLFHSMLRLQEFEEERTRFWARTAHDLRAPLTAAAGYCGILLDRLGGPLTQDQEELLRRIQHMLTKLTRMASTMLQLTAGRQLDARLERKAVDIGELVRHSVDEIRAAAAEKDVQLTVDLTPPPHALYAEPTQMEQVLVNLLENACKFTPRGGRIQVSAYPVPANGEEGDRRVAVGSGGQGGALYRVDVADSGPGVAPENLERSFQEYVSSEGASSRPGTGLGLAISKRILDAHGGAIWMEAAAEGTTCSFVLPLDHPGGCPMAVTGEQQERGAEGTCSENG